MMDTNLFPVNLLEGGNRYCGPAVLSILTGITTTEAETLLRRATGRHNIVGVYPFEMKAALNLMDWQMEEVKDLYDRSLYFTFTQIYSKPGMYVIGVPAHVIAVEVKDRKIYLCDNHTRNPINAGNSARLGQKVVTIHKIGPKPIPMERLIRQYVVPSVGL